jgi:hypothetical protein
LLNRRPIYDEGPTEHPSDIVERRSVSIRIERSAQHLEETSTTGHRRRGAARCGLPRHRTHDQRRDERQHLPRDVRPEPCLCASLGRNPAAHIFTAENVNQNAVAIGDRCGIIETAGFLRDGVGREERRWKTAGQHRVSATTEHEGDVPLNSAESFASTALSLLSALSCGQLLHGADAGRRRVTLPHHGDEAAGPMRRRTRIAELATRRSRGAMNALRVVAGTAWAAAD